MYHTTFKINVDDQIPKNNFFNTKVDIYICLCGNILKTTVYIKTISTIECKRGGLSQ
jgi:hypothetical protein